MSKIMKITKIEQQINNKKRYNIYVNDNYAFSVHEDVLISFRLLKGKEIEQEDFQAIIQEEERNKVWQKSLKYISYRPRTELEVKQYLTRQGYAIELIEPIVNKLKDERLLDDKLYAKQFINQRINSNPKGRKLLAYEMKNRGLSDTVIGDTLEEIDDNLEYEMAVKLTEKKLKQLKGQNRTEVQRKLAAYLGRRGFSYNTINRILQEHNGNNLQSEESF
ncbi:RecX family transcriptional regulator [Vulcanibacillus modesticaldus]|nr:RecX family transcriptional regulator [Vulcanibacillus modesticaldus]